MRNLEASTTYTVHFSTSVAPDAIPTATAYADGTSLGAMTVSSESGTNEYSVAVVLPGNVTQGQVITVAIDWDVDSAAQSTVRLLVGQVGLAAEIASAVADESITGAEHNVQNSIAKFLREAAQSAAVRVATAQSGTANTITLDSNASATDTAYVHMSIALIDGTGRGGWGIITAYDGTTKIATIDRDWQAGTPDSGSEFAISVANSVLARITHAGATIPTVTRLEDGGATDVLIDAIKAKTDLIGTGSATISQPVADNGQITSPIIIGDDYKAANGRAFQWTVDAVTGGTIGTATCHFGVSHPSKGSFNVTGTITDNGDGTWNLSFDVARTNTTGMGAGVYDWSVEVKDDNGNEITRVRNADGVYKAQLVEKQT